MKSSRVISTVLSALAAQTAVVASSSPTPPVASDYHATTVKVQCSESAGTFVLRVTPEDAALDHLFTGEPLVGSAGLTNEPGMPILPAWGGWLRLPERGQVELGWRLVRERRVRGAAPNFEREGEGGRRVDHMNALSGVWPPERAVIGKPAIIRGVRVAPVVCYPVRWDADAGEYLIADGLAVEVRAVNGSGDNEVVSRPLAPSRGFDLMLEHLLLNPPRRDQGATYPPGGYLVVANEDYPAAVDDFVEGKRRAGHPVEVLTFNPAQVTRLQLREMIRDRYENTGFEFLVMMGSEEADPPLHMPYDNTYYDVYFAQLEGDDPYPDVALGAFNCTDLDNFAAAIARSLSYQYEPYVDDLDWFARAAVAVGHCSVPQDLSPSYTGKWVAEVLHRYGFDDVTGIYYADDPNRNNDFSPRLAALYNQGINFILVRGHQQDFNPNAIRASGVFPFHFLTSSATIQPNGGGAFNLAFRMGTPEDLRGPSAGFGHYSSPRTNVANALAGGLTQSMFLWNFQSYGWARNYTVMNLLRVMPADDPDQILSYYFSHWRYYGDPGQGVWLGVPRPLQIDAPDWFDPHQNSLEASVRDADGAPVPDVRVCLVQGDLQMVTRSDARGRVFFTGEDGVFTEEPLTLTALGEGLLPVTQTLEPQPSELLIEVLDLTFNEINGEGDGTPNPGETLSLSFRLENRGQRRIGNGQRVWTLSAESASPWFDVQGLYRSAEIWAPDAGREVADSFLVTIHAGCPDGSQLPLLMRLRDGEDECRSVRSVPVWGARMEATAMESSPVQDSELEIQVWIVNRGRVNSDELIAVLFSRSPVVRIIERESTFPAAQPGDTVQTQRPFRIGVSETALPGMSAPLAMVVEGVPGVQDTLQFNLPIGVVGDGDPLGPDGYGYVAFDNGDREYDQAPVYDWVEICPWRDDRDFDGQSLPIQYGGEADSSVLLQLPFTFRFYGQPFNQITVCSNGWLAVGDQTTLKNQQNWPLPGFDGAFGMIAPFWDRLWFDSRSDFLGWYYDGHGGRVIIEWICGVRNEEQRTNNAFEVIIYDPEVHPTATGDSPILFQYREVNNVQNQWEANAHCSVGISSPDGKDGITYTYWNQYPAGAAPLQAQRAILWTTTAVNTWAVIYGRVTRFIDSTAVIGARITDEFGLGSGVDRQGWYYLNVPPGAVDLELTATAENYGQAVVRVQGDLEAGDSLRTDFVLPHAWLDVEPDLLEINLGVSRDLFVDTFTVANIGNFAGRVNDIVIVPGEPWHPNIGIWLEAEFPIYLPPDSSAYPVVVQPGPDVPPDGIYHCTFLILNDSPEDTIRLPVQVESWRSVPDRNAPPSAFELLPVHPNPLNRAARIQFGVPHAGSVDLLLYDLAGREMMTLVSRWYPAGRHHLSLDADSLPTGLYFVVMRAGGRRLMQRLVVLK